MPDMTAASMHSVLKPVSIHVPARYSLSNPEALVSSRHRVEPAAEATQQLDGSTFTRYTCASMRFEPLAPFGSNKTSQSKDPPGLDFGQI